MRANILKIPLIAALASAAVAAVAQQAEPGVPAATVIAIPPMTTPDTGTRGNEMLAIAWQATQIIEADLRQTSELVPLKPDQKDYYSYPEVTAPSFSTWRAKGARALVTGFVQMRSDGRLTFGCYVYDIDKRRELARRGFVVAANDVRRAAHRCSSLAYQAVTGSPANFDTRIAYVAETGTPGNIVKRIALMDSDGRNHSYLTAGDTLVLTPRLSPSANRIAYVSFSEGSPQVRLIDLATNQQSALIPTQTTSFAPRFSADGNRILFSMMQGPNCDIYVVNAAGGPAQRLTTAPGIDTGGSFSPDGRQIVFESDRSGTQQLYVMNADGSGQRRISFGGGVYAAPEWSPDGQWIAFTHRGPYGRRIGVMKVDGSEERLLTTGPNDDSASWAASSRELLFQRPDQTGRPGLFRIGLDGSAPRQMTIPQPGSDPDWSGATE
ncbi:MAG TPA: Tol-Pal system beta propeller repeat protein TolB [Sphingomicrobium sp.]|nr:Tol-Pal system beta propeller repeat protein TolB [Sphingomicrobium sp.]